MTRIRGVCIIAAPCCGARYAAPRYVSMNFAAFEYWTDGWRDGSLMPNDEGLRKCKCGRFVLMRDLVEIETAERSDLPHISLVPDAMLPECIAQADSEAMEVAARLEYWRYLNHPYREKYRPHRAAEDAAIKARWEFANPDRRTRWDKFLGRKPPVYSRPPGSPFTYPKFEPSTEQLHNMLRLSEILLAWRPAPRHWRDIVVLAELYREQSRFDEAEAIISTLDKNDEDVTSRLVAQMIGEKEPAPMRYRY